jgi:phage shock protein A
MRILSRCSDIIVANINVLLDKAENPEAMIGQVIREMEDDLAVARSHAARAIAAERRLSRELAEQRICIEYWQTKARAAVVANREDLARAALVRKKELEIAAAELATQHTAALETSMQVRTTLHALETNLTVARRKQRSLIARHRAAQARQALCRAAGKRLGLEQAYPLGF